MTIEEALDHLYTYSSTLGRGQTTQAQHEEAKKVAIATMRKYQKIERVLDKIRADITDCLKALDDIEKSGLNIYLPNEISGRRLTYQQCLGFIDKYNTESEEEGEEPEI